MAGAQQRSTTERQQTEQPPAITDPAEYAAYMTAISTVDTAARKEALESFLRNFPNTVMHDEVLTREMDALVQLDNERTAPLRQQLKLHAAQMKAEPVAQMPDSLSRYAQCDFSPFKVEESVERSDRFIRSVTTDKGEQPVEIAHAFSLHIAYKEAPFVNFKAERLANYAKSKQVLIEQLKYLSDGPGMEAAKPWPESMEGFEVYGINHTPMEGGVLGMYLLFRDADQAVVTLYLLNTPPESPSFSTMDEYSILRHNFLRTFTVCVNAPARAARR